MTVKELITVLEGCNQEAEVVVTDANCDDQTEESNSFKTVDVQTGFFDETIGLFTSSPEEERSDDNGIYGVEAVAICIEGL